MDAAPAVTELLHAHTQILPCPTVSVLRTPREEMRGWGGIINDCTENNGNYDLNFDGDDYVNIGNSFSINEATTFSFTFKTESKMCGSTPTS